MDAQTQQLFQRLNNAYASMLRDPAVKGVRQGTPFWTFMNEVGQIIKQYSNIPQQPQPQQQQPAAQAAEDAKELVVLAGWLDEVEAHAMADVVDEAAVMMKRAADPGKRFNQFYQSVASLFRSYQVVVMGEDPKELDQQWLDKFGRDWQRLLFKYSKRAALAGRLTAMAQNLDERGEHVKADLMDTAADYVRRFADDEQQQQEETSPFKPMNETPLSTRYCPDHVGVQTARISQQAVQCPLDGRVYNYEAGYTDYDGQKVPGGSVAGQTPSVMPYGVPNRIYDSRQSVINTIN